MEQGLELVALVGCGRKKLQTNEPVPARKLYTSGLFRSSLRFAVCKCDRIFIVSAEHGLVGLEQPLLPYDKKITDLCRGERKAWAIQVVRDLYNKMDGRFEINGNPMFRTVLLAGSAYADLLYEELRWNRIPVCRPMRGLTQGEGLKWLSHHSSQGRNTSCLILSS